METADWSSVLAIMFIGLPELCCFFFFQKPLPFGACTSSWK